jgi:hypothetical protein
MGVLEFGYVRKNYVVTIYDLPNFDEWTYVHLRNISFRSEGLRWWHINTTITILDIIHRPVLYLKTWLSETEFCLCLWVEPTQMGPIERASLRFWTPATTPISIYLSVCVCVCARARSCVCVEIQGVKMLTLFSGLCCVGFKKPVGVVAGVWWKILALSIEPIWRRSTWKWRQNPDFEM